jgi:hypothetical protein
VKKKSKYKPKGVRLDAMTWVLSGMRKVGQVPTAGVMLKIKNHDAMNEITQGRGKRDNIDIVIAAMNVAEALAMMGVGKDWRDEIRQAQDAILTMAKRGLAKEDRFLLTGQEMQALNLGIDIHDAQLDEATVKQLEEALQLVEREIRQKRARMIAEEECSPL